MFKTLTFLSAVATIALAACGGGEDDGQALASLQNDAHNVAKANAASSFPGAAVDVARDPTISLSCPKGAGVENATVATAAGTTYAQCATYASMPCMVVPAPPVLACNPHLH